MMNGSETSDSVMVAADEQSGVVRSGVAGAKGRDQGNVGQASTRRTQSRISVSLCVGSHTTTFCRQYPRWEPYAGKPPVRFCAGGEATRVPTAKFDSQSVFALWLLGRSNSAGKRCPVLRGRPDIRPSHQNRS